ncbi:hypothetical protein C0J52_04196 [Blattella germanica]|nr:hypothetical protein C0J52_04196 [Blattella germanica]
MAKANAWIYVKCIRRATHKPHPEKVIKMAASDEEKSCLQQINTSQLETDFNCILAVYVHVYGTVDGVTLRHYWRSVKRFTVSEREKKNAMTYTTTGKANPFELTVSEISARREMAPPSEAVDDYLRLVLRVEPRLVQRRGVQSVQKLRVLLSGPETRPWPSFNFASKDRKKVSRWLKQGEDVPRVEVELDAAMRAPVRGFDAGRRVEDVGLRTLAALLCLGTCKRNPDDVLKSRAVAPAHNCLTHRRGAKSS